ncbi:MAG: DUF6677 family protein [Acidobacteriota bacterium]
MKGSPETDAVAASDGSDEQEIGGEPIGRPWLAALLAWLVPGAGHIYLRRRARGVIFFGIVLVTMFIGCLLDGRLYSTFAGHPLVIAASLGSLGAGVPYFLLLAIGYAGVPLAAGYEYGTTFLITGGLMNLLLVLDAWDISTGRKP